MDPSTIRAVSFDCYGTLIDWETGIARYVAPHLERAARVGTVVTPADWLSRWEPIQFGLLGPGSSPYRSYAEILDESFQRTMHAFELECFADGGPGLVRSLADWPPFADTIKALRQLARRRRLAIISNIDRALLAETLGRLLVPLSTVVTAEEAGAYKPDPAPFRLAIARLGVPAEEILHVAFGWKYDLAAARSLGMKTCFVRRGTGPRPDALDADLEVGSLSELSALLCAA